MNTASAAGHQGGQLRQIPPKRWIDCIGVIVRDQWGMASYGSADRLRGLLGFRSTHRYESEHLSS
jgi:hypothetical protein